MMGIEDTLYFECDRRGRVSKTALELLWEEYDSLLFAMNLVSPQKVKGFKSLEEVEAEAEKRVKFTEDFSDGMGHGPKCEAVYPQAFTPNIRCKLPVGHHGSHLGNGIRWETVAGHTSLGEKASGITDYAEYRRALCMVHGEPAHELHAAAQAEGRLKCTCLVQR
jgi:hypothetical protein